MSDFTIYHNPRCSKSRETLALLESNGVTPKIVKYLETPPSAAELKTLIAQLGITPADLVRKSEDLYKTQFAGKTLTDAQWIEAMVKHPVLIERPIVVKGRSAVLGRPPENVKKLLEAGARAPSVRSGRSLVTCHNPTSVRVRKPRCS